MSRTAQEAAAARAAAAKNETVTSRLGALEVERQGYVQRGDVAGVAAVDREIAHCSRELGVPLAASTTSTDGSDPDEEPDLEEAKQVLKPLVIEILHELGVPLATSTTPDTEPGRADEAPTIEPTPEPTPNPVAASDPDPEPEPEKPKRTRRSAAAAADEPAEG